MVLPLKQDIIYGPVNSRRYGKSLGINLMPVKDKLCSFNCVYCHYGLTKRCTMNAEQYESELPSFDEVVESVENTLQSPLELDQITFSGNGEPTLHPKFPELVDAVVELRDKYRPGIKVALLSNSTGLENPDILESLLNIDLPVMKLDAGGQAMFRKINRPVMGIEFEDIVDSLSSLNNIVIQTVFVDGNPSNTGEDDLIDYIGRIDRIKPKEVHLYSIDRPVPKTKLALVTPERLEQISSRILVETGISARAFHD
jgi:wyosine [tRNA(Phe)-imidazoG37] synthetase (radical SAM superfamily)